jgi:hypothetical protein
MCGVICAVFGIYSLSVTIALGVCISIISELLKNEKR